MSGISLSKVVNFIAFVAVILCAVSVVIGKWVPLFGEIAGIIALIVVCVSAFFYVSAKRNTTFMILYVVAIILIVVFKVWAWL